MAVLGWVVWVVLRLVWKVKVSPVSRVRVPRLWWWVSPRVSVIAWVSSGWGLTSTNVVYWAPAVVIASAKRTGVRRLATQ